MPCSHSQFRWARIPRVIIFLDHLQLQLFKLSLQQLRSIYLNSFGPSERLTFPFGRFTWGFWTPPKIEHTRNCLIVKSISYRVNFCSMFFVPKGTSPTVLLGVDFDVLLVVILSERRSLKLLVPKDVSEKLPSHCYLQEPGKQVAVNFHQL